MVVVRLSIPFSPPDKQYRSLEDVVKKIPNYAYWLYFANPESTKEIEANVRMSVVAAAGAR
jgi:soluble epoxide hydrolase/lipid-phosphate phosphatase